MAYTATGLVSLTKGALVARLKADAGVAALVGARVFDIAPQDNRSPKVIYPFIYLGPVGVRRGPTAPCNDLVLDARFRLFVASSLSHRDQAWDVVEAAIEALAEYRADLGAGKAMSSLELADAGDVVNPVEPVEAFADFTTRLQK